MLKATRTSERRALLEPACEVSAVLAAAVLVAWSSFRRSRSSATSLRNIVSQSLLDKPCIALPAQNGLQGIFGKAGSAAPAEALAALVLLLHG